MPHYSGAARTVAAVSPDARPVSTATLGRISISGSICARRGSMLSLCGDATRQSSSKQDEPADYVIATGQPHSVQEFVEATCGHAGLNWQKHVVTDPAFIRPTDVDHLVGDRSRARTELGWEPKTSFSELVESMVDADLEWLSRTGVSAEAR